MRLKLNGVYKLLAVLLSVGIVGMGFAQDEHDGHDHKSSMGNTAKVSAPVTRVEARKVLSEVQTALAALYSKGECASVSQIKEEDGVVTRAEVILEFDRLMRLAQPSFKFQPTAIKYDPARIRLEDFEAKSKLEKLIQDGFCAKVGPISTAETDYLTPDQFGDALGLFLARVADLSHLPSTRWSPYLWP